MITEQITQDKIVKNLPMLFGISLIILGAYMAIDYHTNFEVQYATEMLKQDPQYSKLISIGENLMIGGYVTLLIGGSALTFTGYMLRRCF